MRITFIHRSTSCPTMVEPHLRIETNFHEDPRIQSLILRPQKIAYRKLDRLTSPWGPPYQNTQTQNNRYRQENFRWRLSSVDQHRTQRRRRRWRSRTTLSCWARRTFVLWRTKQGLTHFVRKYTLKVRQQPERARLCSYKEENDTSEHLFTAED